MSWRERPAAMTDDVAACVVVSTLARRSELRRAVVIDEEV